MSRNLRSHAAWRTAPYNCIFERDSYLSEVEDAIHICSPFQNPYSTIKKRRMNAEYVEQHELATNIPMETLLTHTMVSNMAASQIQS